MRNEKKSVRRFPFEERNGGYNWILPDGEILPITWEELKRIVKSPEYQSREFVTMPKDEFQKWYKRMHLPKETREYHADFKRNRLSRKGG